MAISVSSFATGKDFGGTRIVIAATALAMVASGCVLRKGPGGAAATTTTPAAAQPTAQPATTTLVSANSGQAPAATADANAPSNFGTLQISHGFRPDPSTQSGTSGGRLNSQEQINQACRGWIAPRPDHILQLDTAFDYLRLETAAAQDTTLVVRGPDGVRCDDDGAGNRNPRVEGPWQPGRYEVWVGSYRQGEFSRYELTATEYRIQAGAAAPTGNVQASTSGASRYAAAQIQPGFQPDPMALEGQSGGQMDVRTTFSQCRGWIASDRPDHVITLTQPFNYLRIEGNASDDTTLVMQGPAGTLCDDDSAGNRNPRLEGTWPAGTYNVWVGSYNEGRFSRYQLQLTERRLEAAPAAQPTVPATPISTTGSTGADGRYGNFTIVPGFAPQPTIGVGQSGGQLDIRATTPDCRGWIAQDRPDHVITLSQPFSYLRFEATSGDDTTLVIRSANGMRCDDDSAGNRNPRLEGTWQAGRYEVWIGSYNQGRNSRYELSLTEARP